MRTSEVLFVATTLGPGLIFVILGGVAFGQAANEDATWRERYQDCLDDPACDFARMKAQHQLDLKSGWMVSLAPAYMVFGLMLASIGVYGVKGLVQRRRRLAA